MTAHICVNVSVSLFVSFVFCFPLNVWTNSCMCVNVDSMEYTNDDKAKMTNITLPSTFYG